MALRSLDNALPTAVVQERPKKIPRVPVPAATATATATPTVASVLAMNDENATLNAADPPVEYIASDDLVPLHDPHAKIKSLLEDLDSRDWTKICEALNDVRRFALHHPDLLLPILKKVMPVVIKAMRNPRSALCKTSILTSVDIFNSFAHHLLLPTEEDQDSTFDQLLVQLLLKASQDKRFVCEEAEKALKQMAESELPIPLLKKLQTYSKHSNPKVRAKAAVSISCCVSKMSGDVMREFGFEALLQIAGGTMNDRLPEAREAARAIANAVYKGFSEDCEMKSDAEASSSSSSSSCSSSPSAAGEEAIFSVSESWESFCHSNLGPIAAQSVVKITLQKH